MTPGHGVGIVASRGNSMRAHLRWRVTNNEIIREQIVVNVQERHSDEVMTSDEDVNA